MIRRKISKTAISKFSQTAPDSGSQTFQPTTDFAGFSGHFPGYPIMPAMLQVLFGVVVAEELYNGSLVLKKLDKAKFMVPIKPNDTLTIICHIRRPATDTAAEIKTEITIFTAQKKVSSMTLILEPV